MAHMRGMVVGWGAEEEGAHGSLSHSPDLREGRRENWEREKEREKERETERETQRERERERDRER